MDSLGVAIFCPLHPLELLWPFGRRNVCPVVSNAPEAGWGILEDSSTEGREGKHHRQNRRSLKRPEQRPPVRLSVSVAHASGVQAELHGAPRLAFPQKHLFSAMSCVPLSLLLLHPQPVSSYFCSSSPAAACGGGLGHGHGVRECVRE